MARHANIIAEKLRALEDNIVIGSRECLGAGKWDLFAYSPLIWGSLGVVVGGFGLEGGSCLLTLRSFGGAWGLWGRSRGWKVRVWGLGGGGGGWGVLGGGLGRIWRGRLARVSGLGFRVYAVFRVHYYCRA